MRSHRYSAIASTLFAVMVFAACSSPQDTEVTVLDLVPPTQVAEADGASGEPPEANTEGDSGSEPAEGDLSTEGIGDDSATSDETNGGDTTADDTAGTEGGNADGDGDGDPAQERTDRDIAADVADAVMSTSNVTLDTKIEDGAAIAGRTACTGVPDTSTQYPIGLELILGPPGNIGSGTPRIVIRSYDDEATAQAAAAARIASLETCIANATRNNPGLQWGTETVTRPIPGDQLWFPTATMTETHVAYASGRFYAVASNQVVSTSFIPGQVDAWSVSAIQRVIDTLEAETQAEANPTPTPEGQ